ncbi:hypothetical protein [Pseudodesulfovibrio sediminis]|uniref:Uncharacterized protein n=1 Tax=Pseudodesulfovibrio sediminis TaxID=2810563 RepID=A0ABN6ERL7_9BACT|nr:hypothetical protein [Pseudodesulfovibrio sediminis]BCS88067.1 hypothetical protein PSDVSF_13090 [Pseudodesulfovibrio sediminis]
MNRIVNFFKTSSFAVLLFHVGLLLFSWPLLSLPSDSGAERLFGYVIVAWSVIVCLLIVMGACFHMNEERDQGD